MVGPTCAVAVCRSGVAPFSPVYQNTVFAVVPFCSAVAVAKFAGEPGLTRCGGSELKKLLAAATAEAAGSAVCARFVTAVVIAACRLVAVAFAEAPMVNWSSPGGDVVVACSVMVWLEPSGSVRPKEILSPEFGLEPRLTEIDGGEPDDSGAGQARIHARELEAERRTIRAERDVGRRPANRQAAEAPTPSSACRRSEITCVSPA